MNSILDLLSILIGFLIGWKGRDIHDKITALYDYFEERIKVPGGVVRIQPKQIPSRGGRVEVGDDSETGPVLRPSPRQAENTRQSDKEEMERRYNGR